MANKAEFRVMYQKSVGFCGEARMECVKSFLTFEEASKFAKDYELPNHMDEIYIMQIYTKDKNNEDDGKCSTGKES
jgi:hypothetical protein